MAGPLTSSFSISDNTFNLSDNLLFSNSISSSSSVANCVGRSVAVVLNGADVISNAVTPMLPLSPMSSNDEDESFANMKKGEELIPVEFTPETIITVAATSILQSNSTFLAPLSAPSVQLSSSSSSINERLSLKDRSRDDAQQKHKITQDKEAQKRCKQGRQDRITHLKERIQTTQHAKKEDGPLAVIEGEETLAQSILTADSNALVLPVITASTVSIIGSSSEPVSPASSFSTSSSPSPKSKEQEKKERNRVHAQQHRKRQKEYRVGLEQRLKKSEEQNAELRAKNEELLRINAELQAKVQQCMAESLTAFLCT